MILNPTVDSHAKAQGRRARNDSGTVSILVVKGSPIKQVRVTEFPRKHPETPRTLPRAEARAAVVVAARLGKGKNNCR